MTDDSSTIAAIAASSIMGGISILRISGKDAVLCADKILRLKKKKLSDCKSHTIHYGFVTDENGNDLDEVIVLLMRAPNSYTREDVVEIQCHGGSFICQEILDLILTTGVRMAEPGEFTKRAFLNGRIDLSQAEAVMDLIESKSRYALESSMNQLNGMIKEKIVELREVLLNHVAYIEAALDDPEHISLDDFSEKFQEEIEECIKKLKHIMDNYKNGRLIKEGIQTVIVGRPNVGKSSFLNTVLGINRAIVTDVPGTTRDILEEDVRLGELLLHMIDTAGIHQTEDVVEKIGIEKTREKMKQADFCILLLDGSKELTEEDKVLLNEISSIHGVVLLNKNDLDSVVEEEEIRKMTDKKILSFSTKTGSGKEELEEYMKEQFYLNRLSFNDEIYITNERQKQAVSDSYQSLLHVKESIELGLGEDFYTIDLMSAYESLGLIIGERVEDDLVDTIFRKFCMGK